MRIEENKFTKLSRRDKIRSLIDTRNEANTEIAFELAKSIDKIAWIKEDYSSCYDLLLPFFMVQTIPAREKMMKFDDYEKVRYLHKLGRLDLYDLPKDYLTERITQVVKLIDLRITRTKPENVSPLIFDFKSLEHLHLGWLAIKELSEKIGQLKNLKTLDLSSNQLSELPDEIAQLKSLEIIKLERNNFRRFPKVLFQLPNIKKIYFQNNPLGNYESHQANEHFSYQGAILYYKSSS